MQNDTAPPLLCHYCTTTVAAPVGSYAKSCYTHLNTRSIHAMLDQHHHC